MPKSIKTKKRLAEQMKESMGHRSFHKISVGDICEACQLNRKSFYYHFKDKYQLVNWIYYEEFIKTVEEQNYSSMWGLLEHLCCYLYENKEFYANAFAIEGQNSFSEYFTSMLSPMFSKYLEKVMEESEDKGFLVAFYSNALLISLRRWLVDYSEVSPDRYLKLLQEATLKMAIISEA